MGSVVYSDLIAPGRECRQGCSLAVGMFDGVHRGHQQLLMSAHIHARKHEIPAFALSFRQHPLALLAPPYAPPLLTAPDQKTRQLAMHGMDVIALVDFTPELAAMPAEAFVLEYLVNRYQVAQITCGEDFRFGARGAGTVELLRELGARHGFGVDVRPTLVDEHGPIRSTRIRSALAAGEVHEASNLLGRPFALEGLVVEGDRRGRTLGFPTANLEVAPEMLVPPDGVYAIQARRGYGTTWSGMLNIGPRPTFGAMLRTIEAHLFDFEGDLYGTELEIGFFARIRDLTRFDGPEALVAQLQRDREAALAMLQSTTLRLS